MVCIDSVCDPRNLANSPFWSLPRIRCFYKETLMGHQMKSTTVTWNIHVTDHDFPNLSIEKDTFPDDVNVTVGDADTPQDVIEQAADAEGLLNQYAPITEEVFEALDSLKVVARYGIGVDNVDIAAATEHDVRVVNVPSYSEEEVSSHAFALLMATLRKIPMLSNRVKSGTWDWKLAQPIPRIAGNTVGFAAFGKIPQKLAKKLSGFDVDFVAFDPYQSREELESLGVRKVDFDTLLTESDFISIHTPLTDETRGMFDDEAFGKMKEDSILVNTARGPIIDEASLYDAITEGEIAGAGLDVMNEEPPGDSPLFDLDSVVITPHIAWYSEESVEILRREAAEGVAAVLRGEEPENLVNTEVR